MALNKKGNRSDSCNQSSNQIKLKLYESQSILKQLSTVGSISDKESFTNLNNQNRSSSNAIKEIQDERHTSIRWTLVAILWLIMSPLAAIIQSGYSMFILCFHSKNKIKRKMRWLEFFLDFINAAAIIAALTEISLTIAKNMKMIQSVHNFLAQSKDLLNAIGSQFAAYTPFLLAFSMFYDFIDNVKMFNRLQLGFAGTNFALSKYMSMGLKFAHFLTGAAIGTDIGFSIVQLVAKNSHYLLNVVPFLTLAIQAVNILIDIVQTLIFTKKLTQLIVVTLSNNLTNNTNNDDDLKRVSSLSNIITDQYYALFLRTAAKVLVLAACIAATFLNPIVGLLVTLGAVLFSQGYKQEAKNSLLHEVAEKSSLFYRQSGIKHTIYNTVKRHSQKIATKNQEFSNDDESDNTISNSRTNSNGIS